MKTIAICALLTPVIAGGGLALAPKNGRPSSMPSPSLRQAAVVALAAATSETHATAPKTVPGGPEVALNLDLPTAVQQGKLGAEFKGNGRDKVQAILSNKTTVELTVRVPAGQMFEAGTNTVIALRSGEVELKPGQTLEATIQTAATRSGNKTAQAPYQLSFGKLPRLDALLAYAQDRPELSAAALQTAVLALTENLPLSAVAKFSAAGGDLPTKFDTTPFKAETGDILHALLALRGVGAREGELALTIDPQLKIEAMIEPASRAAAMRYYGITPEKEWEFWKTELLSGEPATRHYALYGIARFYPDIALEMLPKWARETKTGAVFRISAIQALADTQKPEALPILQRLADELGITTEFGRTAIGAAKVLSEQLAKMAGSPATVAFTGSLDLEKF